MFESGTILTTSTGGDLIMPTINDTTSKATVVAEYNQSTKKAPSFGSETLKGVNTETTRGSGLINDLTIKIEALEKKKLLPNATVEDIAATNAEIVKLKEELNRLQNITPEQVNRKPLEPILPVAVKPIMPALEVKLPDLKPIITKAQQQIMEIRKTVTEGIYGWAEVTSSGLQSSIMETEAIVGKYTEALVAKGWKFSEALTFVSDKVSEVMKGFDESLSNFIAGSIEAAAEAIGQIISGDLGFDGLMKAILLQLASFLNQIWANICDGGRQSQCSYLPGGDCSVIQIAGDDVRWQRFPEYTNRPQRSTDSQGQEFGICAR